MRTIALCAQFALTRPGSPKFTVCLGDTCSAVLPLFKDGEETRKAGLELDLVGAYGFLFSSFNTSDGRSVPGFMKQGVGSRVGRWEAHLCCNSHSEKARGIGFEMESKMKSSAGGWFSP
jgi:hypothetical protein